MDIDIYKSQFGNLHVKITNCKKAQNKAIMLISVMELIRCKYITSNSIFIDDTIVEAFNANWNLYVGENPPTAWASFWHMKDEPFWHFSPLNSVDDIEKLVAPGETASVGKMKSVIEYAYLDEDLFEIMKTTNGRTSLFEVLKENYLPYKIIL